MSENKNGVAELKDATKPKVKEVKAVLECGMNHQKEEFHMTDIIKRDIFHKDTEGNTILTKELNKVLKSGDDEDMANAKKWVKCRLQTLIKEKSVQELLLGDDAKSKSLTIKKVNLPMLTNEKCLSQFTEDDLGQFRVVKEFEQELEKFLVSYDKTFDDLIPIMEKNLCIIIPIED